MYLGLGIFLIVMGMVFAFDAINVDTSAVDGQALGWILILGGVLAIVLPLLIMQNRDRRTRTVVDAPPATTRRVVEERRVEDPPL